jgi:hypothetical protein
MRDEPDEHLGCFSFLMAFIITILAVMFTGTLFNTMNWPLFHTWGLIHGSIIYIFPVYFVIALIIIWYFARQHSRKRQRK